MFANVGHDAYYIIMAINIISLTVIALFWPETKGVSLEHMYHIFGEVDQVEIYEKKIAAEQREETNQTNPEAKQIS